MESRKRPPDSESGVTAKRRAVAAESEKPTPSDPVVDSDDVPPAPRLSQNLVLAIGRFYGLLPNSTKRRDNSSTKLGGAASFASVGRAAEFLLRVVLQYARDLQRRRGSGVALTGRDVWGAVTLLGVRRVESVTSVRQAGMNSSLRFDATPNIATYGPTPSEQTVDLRTFCTSIPPAVPLPRLKVYWLLVCGRLALTPPTAAPYPPVDGVVVEPRVKLQVQRSAPLPCDLLAADVVSQVDSISHSLSTEHRLLLVHLQRAIRGKFFDRTANTHSAFTRALTALGSAAGLAQLIPYLVMTLVYQVYGAIARSNLFPLPGPGLEGTVQALAALVSNPNVQLHSCLHQITQALLFVVVHPVLLGGPMAESVRLRTQAAQAVQRAVSVYGGTHLISLDLPVSAIYLKILRDPRQALTSVLGAIIGLRALGEAAVTSTLAPMVPRLGKLLKKVLDQPQPAPGPFAEVRLSVAVHVAAELTTALHSTLKDERSVELLESLRSYLGDAADLEVPMEDAVEDVTEVNNLTAWAKALL